MPTTSSRSRTVALVSLLVAPVAIACIACTAEEDLGSRGGSGNGEFVEGSACDPKTFPDCGLTSLDCDAHTKTCVSAKPCTSDADCPDFACRTGVHLCAVACFSDGDCKSGTRCDATTNTCVAAESRSCPPNCTVGHECCRGGCSGPAVAMPSDCCGCLPDEVTSATCGGHCLG